MANEADRGPDYDDMVTITIDRRLAEDLYYDLLLGLGGRDYSEGRVGKTGKSGGKSYASP